MNIFRALFGGTQEDEDRVGRDRYVTDLGYCENLVRQVSLAPVTFAQLERFGFGDCSAYMLEFLFHTNSADKADALCSSLRQRKYEVQADARPSDRGHFSITGWAGPLPLDDHSVTVWVENMCQLGFEHDCEFDSWGVYPE